MADAYEPAWQLVQQEAAQELVHQQLHPAFWFLWAESRQRKITCPFSKATRR
jgi:hypothetical protein